MRTLSWCGVLLVMLASGCATQRHGRLTEVTNLEAEDLTCRQIHIEIEKGNAFIRDVNTKNKKFTGRDILSFLGDFGIGDSWEVNDAIASATDRISQLEQLRKTKCRGDRTENALADDSPEAKAAQEELAELRKELKEKVAVASDESDSGFTLKECANCEQTIGKLEKQNSYEGQLVCQACYVKLSDYAILKEEPSTF